MTLTRKQSRHQEATLIQNDARKKVEGKLLDRIKALEADLKKFKGEEILQRLSRIEAILVNRGIKL